MTFDGTLSIDNQNYIVLLKFVLRMFLSRPIFESILFKMCIGAGTIQLAFQLNEATVDVGSGLTIGFSCAHLAPRGPRPRPANRTLLKRDSLSAANRRS